MGDRTIELLYRNLQEVFGEGDAARRRAAIGTSILKTACCTSRPVSLLDTTLWTSSPETSARHILTSSIRIMESHKPCTTGGILAWGSGPKGEAPDYTGLDVVIVRDGKIAALYVFLNPKFA